jgi:hypothetical protein
MQLLQKIRCLTVTISFVCHQKPHSLQLNQIYGNLVTNIRKPLKGWKVNDYPRTIQPVSNSEKRSQ